MGVQRSQNILERFANICAPSIGRQLKEMVTYMSMEKITFILRDKYNILMEFGDLSDHS